MEARAALSDVKVLDFMWVMAGPAATRTLADYGATVIHVESSTHIDGARTVGPFHGGRPGADTSALYGNNNAGKLGLTLDLAKPAARAVALDLVRWADVVTESFSPKAMRAWGLDYQSLRAVKPEIIMISSCLMGQSGPLGRFAGVGNLAAAIVGFHNVTGWPDRPPAGPFGAYTDYVAPRFSAVAILAALDYRRRTGKGQYIDQSQAESAAHFLGPALLDFTINGRVCGRDGNRDPQFAPHGVYPAAGDDRWVAIVCRTDEQWRALCDLMNRPDLARDPRFATAAARRENDRDLDAALAEWTGARDAVQLETLLQAHGIAASVLRTSADLMNDSQLRHRGHFIELPHPTLGSFPVENSRLVLSRTPAKIDRCAPTMGRDNQYVLETILGYDEEKISALVAAGALE